MIEFLSDCFVFSPSFLTHLFSFYLVVGNRGGPIIADCKSLWAMRSFIVSIGFVNDRIFVRVRVRVRCKVVVVGVVLF